MGYLKIPNLYKATDILLFKECYALEKIHGCLICRTNIRMADGSRTTISDLVRNNRVGDYVLGFSDGKVVPSKILNVFDNGVSENWFNIISSRAGVGKGKHFSSIFCTPNHKIWSENKYIEASSLTIGDKVSLIRSDLSLTPLQEQVLLGKLLGDGSMSVKGRDTAQVEFAHKKEHEEYVNWCMQALGNICTGKKGSRISGYGTRMVTASTSSLFFVKNFLDSFYKEGDKQVPEWVVDKIGPIALAFWYMDDGSLGHDSKQEDRALFATCSFNYESCEVLKRCLYKFGINSVISGTTNRRRLRLNADDADKFFLLVAPYIPKCMQYKLPERYRGGEGWLPKDVNNVYKKHVVEQNVLKINKIKKNYHKYDLETETHNFFAGDILVHNSSAHVAWKEGSIRFFSGGAKHENFVNIFDEEKLKSLFQQLGHDEVTIFGEAYGGKMQGMSKTYGPDLKFVAFDVKIDNTWLNVPNAEDVSKKLNLEFVSYEKIPAELAHINAQRDQDSFQAIRNGMGPGKIQEGVVLRPLQEMFDSRGNRLISKHKRDEFKETRTPREVDPHKLEVLSEAEDIANEWVTDERLRHVLDKLPQDISIEDTGKVIKAMVQDVLVEAEGEIINTKEARKAIGRRTGKLFKKHFQKKLEDM